MNEYIGRSVRYFDYLGIERFGRILFVEESYIKSIDSNVYYVYIEDEEPEINVHQLNLPDKIVMYAEIRLATEVYLI